MSSTMRRGTSAKLSQKSSTMAAIMRFRAVTVGRFSSRDMVGCEHKSAPLSGPRPRAILKAGSQRIAVVGVRVAGRDQQGAKADHLRDRMVGPCRRPRVGEAAGEPLGDGEPALNLG